MARPVLRTAFCDLAGVEYPVALAGMGPVAGGIVGPVATAELAAAVSNAGGLGVIGGSGYGPERLRREIARSRELTDKPFGVDLLLPANYLGEAANRPPPADRYTSARRIVPSRIGTATFVCADMEVERVYSSFIGLGSISGYLLSLGASDGWSARNLARLFYRISSVADFRSACDTILREKREE